MARHSRRTFVQAIGITSAGLVAYNAELLGTAIAGAEPIVLGQTGRGLTPAQARLIESKLQRIHSAAAQRERLLAAADSSGDVLVSISEGAINKFLLAHYNNNPKFYKPAAPVYQITYKASTISFRAQVQTAAVIKLNPPPAARDRLERTIAAIRPSEAFTSVTQLPPNVQLSVQHVTLFIDIPVLANPSTSQTLQVDFAITIDAMLRLVTDIDASQKLQLTSFSATLDVLADPSLPNIGPIPVDCKPLADFLRDALVIGGNVALQHLTSDLTEKLPLPPIDVVNGISLFPKDLTIAQQRIQLTATLSQGAASQLVASAFEAEMATLETELRPHGGIESAIRDAAVAIQKAGNTISPESLESYLDATVPAIGRLSQRLRDANVRRNVPGMHTMAQLSPKDVLASDLVVEISSAVVDALAKKFLAANAQDCSPWLSTPEVPTLPYARGRGCYIFQVYNAAGNIPAGSTTIQMSCQVNAAGYLQLQACWDDPCGPDACSPVLSIGLGIRGPGAISVTVSTGWIGNSSLFLQAHVDSAPGLYVIGLPPGLDQIANMVLGFITSTVLKAFLNGILSVLSNVPIIRVSDTIPAANVRLTLSNFAVGNDNGRLAVGGAMSFA